jgi:hypothetical protein
MVIAPLRKRLFQNPLFGACEHCDFGDAFGDMQSHVTPHQARGDQELEEWTDNETTEDGQRAAVGRCPATRDGVATDGSQSLVRRSTGLPRNCGDNSNVGRERHAATLDSQRKMPARKMAQKQPPPPPPMATCAIEGCTVGTVLHADHKCRDKRGRVFHNMCARGNGLCDNDNDNELDVRCSVECKRSKKQICFV